MMDMPDPDLRLLEEAVSNLPQLQRQIFMAHRVERLSYAEIAANAGLSVRRVERHMAKALYKLAKQLDGHKLTCWERWF